jgi:hypothetical protein
VTGNAAFPAVEVESMRGDIAGTGREHLKGSLLGAECRLPFRAQKALLGAASWQHSPKLIQGTVRFPLLVVVATSNLLMIAARLVEESLP